VLANDETGSGITVANGQIYWLANAALRTCPAPDCTGGPSNLVTGTSASTRPGDVLVANSVNRIYVAQGSNYNAADGALWHAPLLGGAAQAVPGAPANPQEIVSDGTNLYWINSSTYTNNSQNTDGRVLRMALAGGSVVPLAEGLQGDISYIAVGGGAVYFGGSVWIAGAYEHGVFRLPLPNGVGSSDPPRFADLPPRGLIADDDYVYFTSGSGVYRCPHAGCATPPEVIAPGQSSPDAITQDAVSIYWVTRGSLATPETAAVRRLAK
jgi:hypothetical protein